VFKWTCIFRLDDRVSSLEKQLLDVKESTSKLLEMEKEFFHNEIECLKSEHNLTLNDLQIKNSDQLKEITSLQVHSIVSSFL
jgi:hypothetical protein